MKRIYLDSNVFISLFNQEIGRHTRGLFVEAESFFEEVKKQGCVLVLSKWFFREAVEFCFSSKEETLDFFNKAGIKTEVADSAKKPQLEYLKESGLHYSDLLHAAVAIQQKCDCIVTFNLKDFKKLKEKITVFEPASFT